MHRLFGSFVRSTGGLLLGSALVAVLGCDRNTSASLNTPVGTGSGSSNGGAASAETGGLDNPDGGGAPNGGQTAAGASAGGPGGLAGGNAAGHDNSNSGGAGGNGADGEGASSGNTFGGSTMGGAPSGGAPPGGSGNETGGDDATGSVGGSGATGGVDGSGAATTGSTPGGGALGTGGALVLLPTIADLQVEANPNSTISAYVNWTTNVATDSMVLFGNGAYEYRIYDDTATTNHRVLLIGMHADTDYQIRAVSTNEEGSDSATTTFSTGPLPDTLPLPVLTLDEAGSQSGWTLVTIQPDDSVGEQPPGLAVMYDERGEVVWYYVNGDLPDEHGDVSIDFLPNGNVLVGPTTLEPPKEVDLGGNVVWLGPPQPSEAYGPTMSHDVRKLSTGNYVLLRNQYDADGFLGALIEEVTPDNDVVWSWSLFDHIQPEPSRDDLDWCHPNSVTIDENQNYVYLACRWLGIIKINRYDDQSVIWTLGEGLDGGSFAFDPAEASFADEHDPEFHDDDGTVLVYDNGGFTVPPTGNEHSQALEFTLDEAGLVATLTWSFPGDFSVDAWYHDSWYTPFWGDADRLTNGNVLITAGMRSQSASGRIFEVQRDDGQIVWEIVFDPNVGCYQSERISPPPLVERL